MDIQIFTLKLRTYAVKNEFIGLHIFVLTIYNFRYPVTYIKEYLKNYTN